MFLRFHPDASRYEMKYLVDELRACGVRDFIRQYLQRDRHCRSDAGWTYPSYSLYLDGPGLMLYRATCQGLKNRYKLRIRYYDQNPNSPGFFEIKRRVGQVIIKERAAVRKSSIERLLAGFCPQRSDLIDPDDLDEYSVLRRFCELRTAIAAQPKIIVHYHREAWVCRTDAKLRVSFDRKLATARYDGTLHPSRWIEAPTDGVILELKFNDRFPLWMEELTRNWDLHRVSMPKYVHCTDRLMGLVKSLPQGHTLRSLYERPVSEPAQA